MAKLFNELELLIFERMNDAVITTHHVTDHQQSRTEESGLPYIVILSEKI